MGHIIAEFIFEFFTTHDIDFPTVEGQVLLLLLLILGIWLVKKAPTWSQDIVKDNKRR